MIDRIQQGIADDAIDHNLRCNAEWWADQIHQHATVHDYHMVSRPYIQHAFIDPKGNAALALSICRGYTILASNGPRPDSHHILLA